MVVVGGLMFPAHQEEDNAMSMTREERAALCRRIASQGGHARAAALSAQRRREIASQGFWSLALKIGPETALRKVYGDGAAFQNPDAARAKATARARARRAHPAPQPCHCGNPAAHLHHRHGALVSDDVEPLCPAHHAAAEAALRYGQPCVHGV